MKANNKYRVKAVQCFMLQGKHIRMTCLHHFWTCILRRHTFSPVKKHLLLWADGHLKLILQKLNYFSMTLSIVNGEYEFIETVF